MHFPGQGLCYCSPLTRSLVTVQSHLHVPKCHGAKPAVLGAQVPHSAVPGALVVFVCLPLYFYLMQNFSIVFDENG